jgi:predicted PurR-regulated permease PerM
MTRWDDRSRLAWSVFGLALAAALVFVVYSFVGTVVFGVFLYYATRPVFVPIRRRLGQPTVAAAIALVALAAPALALVSYTMLVVATEAERLLGAVEVVDVGAIPGVDEQTLALLSDPGALATLDWTSYLSTDTVGSVLSGAGDAVNTVAFFGTGFVHLFAMFALAFYLLRDGDRLRRWAAGFTDDRGVLLAYAEQVDRDYRNVFFGNILNAALTGTIGALAYSALNLVAPPGLRVPAAALVGLLTGVASLIPVVGMKLVYVPVAAGMAGSAAVGGATETLWFVAAFAVVSFVVVDTIPDLVLRPYVSGGSLHVGTVMLAYTLGPLLFGWYGIFLMPMLLVLIVQFVRIVLPELVTGNDLQPYSVDPTYLGAASADPTATDPSADVAEPDPHPDGGAGATDGRVEPDTTDERVEPDATDGRVEPDTTDGRVDREVDATDTQRRRDETHTGGSEPSERVDETDERTEGTSERVDETDERTEGTSERADGTSGRPDATDS